MNEGRVWLQLSLNMFAFSQLHTQRHHSCQWLNLESSDFMQDGSLLPNNKMACWFNRPYLCLLLEGVHLQTLAAQESLGPVLALRGTSLVLLISSCLFYSPQPAWPANGQKRKSWWNLVKETESQNVSNRNDRSLLEFLQHSFCSYTQCVRKKCVKKTECKWCKHARCL